MDDRSHITRDQKTIHVKWTSGDLEQLSANLCCRTLKYSRCPQFPASAREARENSELLMTC